MGSPIIRTVVLDAMGVMFQTQDDVAELLVPFIQRINPKITSSSIEEAYLELIRRIGKAPEDILFVDDRMKNVHAARAVGLRSIVFDSRNRFRGDVSGFAELSDIVAGAPAGGDIQIPDS